MIPIVNSSIGTVTNVLLLGQNDSKISGRVETIKTTALLRSAWSVLETWGDFTVIETQVKNYQQTLLWKTLKRVKWW